MDDRRKVLMAGIFLLASTVAPLAWADSISPGTFSATVAVGASATVVKTVTVNSTQTRAVTNPLIDVFFLADTTESMDSALASVKAQAFGLLGSTALLGDVRWAVGEYKDLGSSYAYKVNTGFTSNQTLVQNGIGSWNASGGGDIPEAGLFGLENAADNGGWRAAAGKVLVWFGDAPSHDFRLGSTEASATAALQAQGIKVQAVNLGDLDQTGQATRITAATGGGLFAASGEGVGQAIADAFNSAAANYSTVCLDLSEVPTGLSAAAAPLCISGSFDRSQDRDFDFALEFTGAIPGTYDFNVHATVDGGRVATEFDTITVTGDTTSVPEPSSLALLGLALFGAGAARRKIPRG